jgi:carbon-monoxide dehydrogenase medium subunit
MIGDGYAAPRSVEDAVALLTKNPEARVLAGGHGLLVEPGRRGIAGKLLVDLGRIQGLDGIEREKDGAVKIGAMATLAAIAASDAVKAASPMLADAAASIGDIQMRNRATLGGTLASSDPEAVLPAIALALEAVVHVSGPTGTRSAAAPEGPPRKPLGAGEVITAITFPAAAKRSGAAYEAFTNPATLSALCGVAAAVTLGADGTVSSCRLALTGATDRPERLPAVEQLLSGKRPDATTLSAAAARAGEGLAFRGDVMASAEYRAHLARVLTERAVRKALDRAGR